MFYAWTYTAQIRYYATTKNLYLSFAAIIDYLIEQILNLINHSNSIQLIQPINQHNS